MSNAPCHLGGSRGLFATELQASPYFYTALSRPGLPAPLEWPLPSEKSFGVKHGWLVRIGGQDSTHQSNGRVPEWGGIKQVP